MIRKLSRIIFSIYQIFFKPRLIWCKYVKGRLLNQWKGSVKRYIINYSKFDKGQYVLCMPWLLILGTQAIHKICDTLCKLAVKISYSWIIYEGKCSRLIDRMTQTSCDTRITVLLRRKSWCMLYEVLLASFDGVSFILWLGNEDVFT